MLLAASGDVITYARHRLSVLAISWRASSRPLHVLSGRPVHSDPRNRTWTVEARSVLRSRHGTWRRSPASRFERRRHRRLDHAAKPAMGRVARELLVPGEGERERRHLERKGADDDR